MENRLGYFFIETPDVEKARAFYAAIPSDTPNGRSAVVCDDQAVNFTVWTP